jgi:hypothetical protein
MQFSIILDDMSILLELDGEPAEVDLTRDGLGDRCLDAGVEAMLASHQLQCDPATGEAWAPLLAATIRQKGSDRIGVRSGTLLNPERWRNGSREIEPRYALWSYPSLPSNPGSIGHARGFHCGAINRPARPIIGWSEGAKDACRGLIQAAQKSH